MGLDKDIQALLDAEEQAKQPEFTEEDVLHLIVYWSTLIIGNSIGPEQLMDLVHNVQDTNPKLWEAIDAMLKTAPVKSGDRSWTKHAKFNNKYGPKLSLDIKPTL